MVQKRSIAPGQLQTFVEMKVPRNEKFQGVKVLRPSVPNSKMAGKKLPSPLGGCNLFHLLHDNTRHHKPKKFGCSM